MIGVDVRSRPAKVRGMSMPSKQISEDLRLERLLKQQFAALEYQLSDDDRAFLKKLRPTQMRDLLKRLVALVALKEGETTQIASQIAGVSVPTMFRLKRIWKSTGSNLKSIAGGSARKARGGDAAEKFTKAREYAERLAESVALEGSLNAFATQIVEAHKDVSLRAAERIAREVLKKRRLVVDNLKEGYGRDILVDAVGISLLLALPGEESREDGERLEAAVLAVVLDKASGLILGARVVERRNAVTGQRAALIDARHYIYERGIDIHVPDKVRLHVTVGPIQSDRDRHFAETMKTLLGSDVVLQGSRRFGRKAIPIIGSSIGSIKFIPGATETGRGEAAAVRAVGREPLSLFKADEVVSAEVSAYNQTILDRLEVSGAIRRIKLPSQGSMCASLEEVIKMLRRPILSR